jgi:hypothetical protein
MTTPSTSKELAQAGNYVEAVIALVRERDWVTFVEIKDLLSPHVETAGFLAFEVAPNLVLWAGMSQQFCDVIHAVRASNAVELVPDSYLSYLVDGMTLRMPLAKRPPPGGYKTEHWAPVCFRVQSSQQPTRRRRHVAEKP